MLIEEDKRPMRVSNYTAWKKVRKWKICPSYNCLWLDISLEKHCHCASSVILSIHSLTHSLIPSPSPSLPLSIAHTHALAYKLTHEHTSTVIYNGLILGVIITMYYWYFFESTNSSLYYAHLCILTNAKCKILHNYYGDYGVVIYVQHFFIVVCW